MGYILHQNKWSWGRAETIVVAEGFGLCRVSVEDEDKSVAWLTNLIVFDAMRRQGLGNRLLDIAIMRAAKMGAKILRLWVEEKNSWQREWYERRGFVLTDKDFDEVVLEMDLKKHFNGH